MGLNTKEHTHMGVFSVSGAKGVAKGAPNTENTPTWVSSPCSTRGGRQRARQTRKSHSRGCAVRVRHEGGEIEHAEHREHTHMGVFSVFDARWEERVRRTRKTHPSGCFPCSARGGMQRVGRVWHEGERRGREGCCTGAEHEKHATWACFSCLAGRGGEGRGGEGRHVGMSGIPSG